MRVEMKKSASAFLYILAATFMWAAAAANPAMAQGKVQSDFAKLLVGTWSLTSYSSRSVETNEVFQPLGDHPMGYLQYSPGGHMISFLSSGKLHNVKPPFSDPDKLSFYNATIGYCGTYTVKGNTVTHHVLAAYRPDFAGGDQIRFVKLDGNKLT